MKNTLIFLIGIFIFSCNQKTSNKSEPIQNKSEIGRLIKHNDRFDWLIGNWKRLTNDSEHKTFENWEKDNNRYLGHGFVMKGFDTIWQEKMILSKDDSIWVLAIKTPGNNDLVEFRMTEHDSNSLTVENPNHDFPKIIKYWKNDEQLNALVSGNEKELNFEFEHIK